MSRSRWAGAVERRVRLVGRERLPGFSAFALCPCYSFGYEVAMKKFFAQMLYPLFCELMKYYNQEKTIEAARFSADTLRRKE